MKVRAVKSIPEIQYHGSEKNDIMKLLDKFSKSKAKYWEVIYTEDEYASVNNLCESLRDGIVAGQFCGMKIHRRGTAVYLAKE